MKCPKCKGYGIVGSAVPDILRGRGAIFSSNECEMCNGTGEVQTNEEWFCGLSTEEKAEFSMRVLKNCEWCLDGGSPQECPFNEFSEHCPAESKENMVKWLKEKHE